MNTRSTKTLVLFLFIVGIFGSSCTSYKKLTYLEGVQDFTSGELNKTEGVHEPRIMPNDILSITVNSEIAGAADNFNLPLVVPNNGTDVRKSIVTSTSLGTLQNYLVDKDGTINFPVLGKLYLKDMTISEAENCIGNFIYPEYISIRPIVSIRQLNFSISVLGEVNKPGIYVAENGQMTLLDALAAAGDMTIYGVRDKVLLVRIQSNGELAFHEINLRDKNTVLDKNLFYLQQNDKLYVQANRAKGNSSNFGTLETVGLSALSVIISIIAITTR